MFFVLFDCLLDLMIVLVVILKVTSEIMKKSNMQTLIDSDSAIRTGIYNYFESIVLSFYMCMMMTTQTANFQGVECPATRSGPAALGNVLRP